VLGLATGSTPVSIYNELIRLHREAGRSIANVVTFNLDEYWPMQPHELQSYHRFMREHLFDHIDIDPANMNLPCGAVPANAVHAHCEEYERRIREHGGIDLQLLGIGRTGHVGCNRRSSRIGPRSTGPCSRALTSANSGSDPSSVTPPRPRATTPSACRNTRPWRPSDLGRITRLLSGFLRDLRLILALDRSSL